MSDLLTVDGLARFGRVAAAQVGDEKVPGLVALVAHREQVHVEARGSLSIGGPPVQRDSLFRISSTTKPVTGAATLALIGEDLLGLDDPVAELLPSWRTPACCAAWTDRWTTPSRPPGRSRSATC